ncbi:MAG: nucleotidyltransferase domain-containing protein [Peptococcaceae bacterium]|nr:nucleotidyltransferase domain-containing protein [Peptococcaceae bacterium]
MEQVLLDELRNYLVNKYGCHLIILYGSYATGEYTAESDIDVVCFCDDVGVENDTTVLSGRQLDAWIYSTGSLNNIEPYLHITDGKVIFDQRGLGGAFLSQIAERYAKEPEQLSEEQKQFLKRWLQKMLRRSTKGDPEGDYRFHWMLTDSLEIYFKIKGLWFMGPKKSLKWLNQNDAYTYTLFKSALVRGATSSDVARLIHHIVEL